MLLQQLLACLFLNNHMFLYDIIAISPIRPHQERWVSTGGEMSSRQNEVRGCIRKIKNVLLHASSALNKMLNLSFCAKTNCRDRRFAPLFLKSCDFQDFPCHKVVSQSVLQCRCEHLLNSKKQAHCSVASALEQETVSVHTLRATNTTCWSRCDDGDGCLLLCSWVYLQQSARSS